MSLLIQFIAYEAKIMSVYARFLDWKLFPSCSEKNLPKIEKQILNTPLDIFLTRHICLWFSQNSAQSALPA